VGLEDVEGKLTAFKDYYNAARVHASLDGNTTDGGWRKFHYPAR